MSSETGKVRGISRPTRGLLASGTYATLTGIVYFYPLTLNSVFIGADESANNVVFGVLLYLIGSILLSACLAGLGLRIWATILVALLNPLLVLGIAYVMASLLDLRYPGIFFTLVGDAVLLLGGSVLLAIRSQRAQAWALSFGLGLVAAVLVALIFVQTAPRFTTVCCVDIAPVPYVSPQLAGLSFGVIVAVFLNTFLMPSRRA
jgi:hypothetical protein